MSISDLCTSNGSEFLWYGRPDIMMLPMGGVSGVVVVPEQSDDEDDKVITEFCPEFENHKSVVEVKPSSSLRVEKNVQQIVSIAITFSMFQKISQLKMNLRKTNSVSLVPIIASSSRNFDIYLYDSKNDILLRNMGAPIALWEDERVTKRKSRLKISSVLQLWMAINHLSVQPRLSKMDVDFLTGSCSFLSHLTKDGRIEDIEATLRMARSFFPQKKQEYEVHLPTLSPSLELPAGVNPLLDDGEK